MTKAELISAMMEKTGLTKKNCEKAISALTDAVSGALSNGDKVALSGFGTFEVRERKERTGINPKTKQKITIKATKAPVFKAGKALKEQVK